MKGIHHMLSMASFVGRVTLIRGWVGCRAGMYMVEKRNIPAPVRSQNLAHSYSLY
jgi:hypothetical protein